MRKYKKILKRLTALLIVCMIVTNSNMYSSSNLLLAAEERPEITENSEAVEEVEDVGEPEAEYDEDADASEEITAADEVSSAEAADDAKETAETEDADSPNQTEAEDDLSVDEILPTEKVDEDETLESEDKVQEELVSIAEDGVEKTEDIADADTETPFMMEEADLQGSDADNGIILFGIHQEPVAIYEFYVDGERIEKATQILKSGEKIQFPAAPEPGEDRIFHGWYEGDQEIADGAVAKELKKTENTEVHVRIDARFSNIWHVTFQEPETGVVLDIAEIQENTEEPLKNTLQENGIDIASVNYQPSGGKILIGWSTEEHATAPDFTGTTVISGNITVYPVLKEGYQVTFNSNGGSYITTVPVEANGKVTVPKDPIKEGFSFAGWSESEDGAVIPDIDEKVFTADTTLYAKWEAEDSTYILQIWLENANDDGYTYEKSRVQTAKTGEIVRGNETSYTTEDNIVFTYAYSEPTVVKGDGSSILKVYYSRPVYTLTFKTTNAVCGKEENSYNNLLALLFSQEAHKHTDACYTIYSGTFKYDQDLSSAWETSEVKKYREDGYYWEPQNASSVYYTYLPKMPSEDLTLTAVSTNGVYTYTWYYCMETLNGVAPEGKETKYADGKWYYIDKKLTIHANGNLHLTYKEDYFPISGFVQAKEDDGDARSWYSWETDSTDRYNRTAYLYYNRVSYDLTFFDNYDTGKVTKCLLYETPLADLYKTIRPTEREGYTFEGWYLDPECETPVSRGPAVMPPSNMAVYAKWTVPEYTVTVTVNTNGKPQTGTLKLPEGTRIQPEDLEELAEELGIDTKDPNFLGWYRIIGNKPVVFYFGNPINENIYLAPNWKDALYKVIYDPNGGISADGVTPADATEYIYGAKAIVKSGAALRGPNGEAFDHWEANGNKYYANQTVFIDGDVILKAVYKNEDIAQVTVTYDPGKGRGTPVTTQENVNNFLFTAASYTDPAFADWEPPVGMEFDYWTDADGVRYDSGSQARADQNGSNVLMAHYKLASYTVLCLDAKEDGTELYKYSYTAESAPIKLPQPVKDGYIFDGWIGEGIEQAEKEITIETGSTGDKVYYAVFTADFEDIAVKGIDREYDGTDFSISVSGTLPEDDISFFCENQKIPNKFRNVELSEDGTVTQKNVTVQITRGTEEISKDVSVRITPKTVLLKSADRSKVYDGTELKDNVLELESGWAAGEGAQYYFSGSQTLVGSSVNSFTYVFNENTRQENYNIQKEEGILTVTDGSDASEGTIDPDKVLQKQHKAGAYNIGDTIDFTITVKNIYAKTQTIYVKEQDHVTITGSSVFEHVEPGEKIQTTASYTVTEQDILNGTYTNTVEAVFTGEEGTKTFQNTDVVEEELAKPEGYLTLVKDTVESPESGIYYLGDTITYEITAINAGNLTLKEVIVEDPLTKDKWTIPELKPGEQTKQFTMRTSYVVTESDVLAGKVENEVFVTNANSPTGEQPMVDTGRKEVAIHKTGPALSVIKEAAPKEGGGAYQLGEEIAYKITVINHGDSTIKDITVEDPLTEETWTIDQLAAGKSVILETSYRVTEADTRIGTVVNEVFVSGSDPDGSLVKANASETVRTEVAKAKINEADTIGSFGNTTIGSETISGRDRKNKEIGLFDLSGFNSNPTGIAAIGAVPTTGASIFSVTVPSAKTVDAVDAPAEETAETELVSAEEGIYELIPIPGEEEVPLANLGDGMSECCMHFFLMLTAMAAFIVSTIRRRKHQVRIFELRESIQKERQKK